jgi:hypothetical protein
MRIILAKYGGMDCTDIVSTRVRFDKLMLRVNNDIIGDPSVGQVKSLELSWEHDDLVHLDYYKEGSLVSIPKTGNKRLGIFYSNNNQHSIWNAIYKSLDTIKIASNGKADIITCLWEDMPLNPFLSVFSWYKSQSHLNQLLQIMQCLFMAREMGDYEYVSFLEHDVMYPEGYFDYPDFAKGEVLTNMNYGGINKDGWQHKNQNDEPFHQMTMRLEDAIEHCLNILPNALKVNCGNIETDKLKRSQWASQNEAIHINHGNHFTSHNSIYSKENTYATHKYWGNHEDYLDLFNN